MIIQSVSVCVYTAMLCFSFHLLYMIVAEADVIEEVQQIWGAVTQLCVLLLNSGCGRVFFVSAQISDRRQRVQTADSAQYKTKQHTNQIFTPSTESRGRHKLREMTRHHLTTPYQSSHFHRPISSSLEKNQPSLINPSSSCSSDYILLYYLTILPLLQCHGELSVHQDVIPPPLRWPLV